MIITYICKYYNLDEDVLRGQSRGRDVVNGRQIAMYLIRRMTNLSLNDIGKEFGGRDHTTVLHSLDKVEKQMRPTRRLPRWSRRSRRTSTPSAETSVDLFFYSSFPHFP